MLDYSQPVFAMGSTATVRTGRANKDIKPSWRMRIIDKNASAFSGLANIFEPPFHGLQLRHACGDGLQSHTRSER